MTPLEWQITILRSMVVVLMYLFLFFLVVIAWRQSQPQPAQHPAPAQVGSGWRLVVVDPGETTLARGMIFPLTSPLSLGRDATNSVIVPDRTVSAVHARLVRREGYWWLEDLGSTNGTSLNSARISSPMIVSPGDILTVGGISFRLEG
ncbi:MAG: FHA domain-containing protein [Chloroflexi bacterium]|nr:FHA domain-containing protein [Chloroflexota bacterium]